MKCLMFKVGLSYWLNNRQVKYLWFAFMTWVGQGGAWTHFIRHSGPLSVTWVWFEPSSKHQFMRNVFIRIQSIKFQLSININLERVWFKGVISGLTNSSKQTAKWYITMNNKTSKSDVLVLWTLLLRT